MYVVERHRRSGQAHLPDFSVRDHEQAMGKRLARQAPLGLRQRCRRLAVRGDDAVSRGETGRGRRAPRLDPGNRQRATRSHGIEAGPRERIDLPGEGEEGDSHGRRRDEQHEPDAKRPDKTGHDG
jgi:hypothetical protein